MQLTTNFHLSEFLTNEHTMFNQKQLSNIQQGAEYLEVIRKLIGEAIIINSGLRSLEHNEVIGGSANSFHLHARAVDIWAKGTAPGALYKSIDFLRDSGDVNCVELIEYATFVHYAW